MSDDALDMPFVGDAETPVPPPDTFPNLTRLNGLVSHFAPGPRNPPCGRSPTSGRGGYQNRRGRVIIWRLD